MLNLPYYKDLCAMNLLNDDETQEIIKIVRAAGYCGGEMRGVRRGREGEGGWVAMWAVGRDCIAAVDLRRASGGGARAGAAPGARLLRRCIDGAVSAADHLATAAPGGEPAPRKTLGKVENLLAIVKRFR